MARASMAVSYYKFRLVAEMRRKKPVVELFFGGNNYGAFSIEIQKDLKGLLGKELDENALEAVRKTAKSSIAYGIPKYGPRTGQPTVSEPDLKLWVSRIKEYLKSQTTEATTDDGNENQQ